MIIIIIIIVVVPIIIIVIILIIIIIIIVIIIIIIISSSSSSLYYYYHYYYYYYYYYYYSVDNIPYQCDINCADHFTLDALASRPVACVLLCWIYTYWTALHRLSPDSKRMGPTWAPHGDDRIQVGPMLAPWTLLSGSCNWSYVLPQKIFQALDYLCGVGVVFLQNIYWNPCKK